MQCPGTQHVLHKNFAQWRDTDAVNAAKLRNGPWGSCGQSLDEGGEGGGGGGGAKVE